MGYLHINNLYKDQDILMFKQCYAMEKIHGTSAHISWDGQKIEFFSGGVKHSSFVELFDADKLTELFSNKFGDNKVTVYGEAYGGSCQRMHDTYGKDLRFVAFDVKINNNWQPVPNAHSIAADLGLDFVHYALVSTDLEALDAERDAESTQAIRNGMGSGHMREGVVLRPPFECLKPNGERVIAKHKRPEFRETRTERNVDPLKHEEKMRNQMEAQEFAREYVTQMRLEHVLDKLFGGEPYDVKDTGKVIEAMVEDIKREATEEVEWNRAMIGAISKETALTFKRYVAKVYLNGGDRGKV